MELIVICSNFIRMFVVTILIYFTYKKVTDFKNNNKYENIFIIVCSINISILYIVLMKYFLSAAIIVVLYLIYGLIINKTVKSHKAKYNIIAYIFSCVIAYVIYLIAIMISGAITFIVLKKGEYSDPISLIIIPLIYIMLFVFIFSRKRFKNGFNFLRIKNNNIKNFIFFFIGSILIVFGLLQESDNTMLEACVFIGSLFIIISLTIWTKSQITKTYKNKMRDRTIEIQKTEIDEKNKKIEEIKTENLKLATAIHKYNHKFEALELAMKNALNLESKTEFAEEISVILKEAEETSRNFAKATEVNMAKLPETNIPGIDNMFRYMQEETAKNNINFDLKLNTSIHPLIDNTISKEKFEILIGDHLKDAIIAVNSSEKSYKSILVILGLVDGVYEFSVYDTGIEFEIDTLLKLGKEQVTTHKETGGSGIGFMTTFETLKECRGSLIIEEYNPETTSYTKSVTIRFDGKNKYKICSYRAEKIKEQKTKRRIIIQKLK